MTNILRPMLAEDYDPESLVLPALFSPKIDGFRTFMHDGPLTRSGKPLPNDYVRTALDIPQLNGLDGELVVGAANNPKAFNEAQSALRKKAGEPDFHWWVFDDRTVPSAPFTERLRNADRRVQRLQDDLPDLAHRIHIVEHKLIRSLEELDDYEAEQLELGFEGVMGRKIDGPYKFGRSTVKEGYLLKVKRFVTEEATITRFEEQMENHNEAFKDELGRTKRSDRAEGKVGSGMVGAFWVKSPNWPREFKISCGSMSHDEKADAFVNFDTKYKDQLTSFEYFPHGTLEVPRHGLYKGLRAPEDMS